MIGQKLLMQFHARIKEAKPNWNDTMPFAGLNIIFTGDFMQLPPVLDTPLYRPPNIGKTTFLKPSHTRKQISKSINNQTVIKTSGRELWLLVKHTIILKKQMRQINDTLYASILDNLRHGQLTTTQTDILYSRIITENEITSPEWETATFLVRRNEL